MKIGVTGHQKLADPLWVKQEILRVLHDQPTPFVGITSLAVGADQLFAEAVIESAGSLQAVIPCKEYLQSIAAESRAAYENLLSQATWSEVLSNGSCSEEAYLSAGKRVVDLSELMIAVWNGKPAAGLGGTADIVEYAKSQGKRCIHINPLTQMLFDP